MATNSNQNAYNVDYSKPGLVLIINNQNFVQTEERKGSDKDVDRIMDTFENLNFKTRSFMNQTKQQMKDLVENYSKKDYSNDSCFVCFIMSHGDNGKILCSDEVLIDLKKEIIKPFQINQTLVNKPKLFFIQACRGNGVMPHIERLNISHDLIRQTSNIETDAIKIPMHADLLYSYATVEGYVALRDRNRGSWYVQILCDVISNKAASEEFSHILLEVNDRMAEKEIVISSFECQLRKKLYLARNKNISRIIKKVYDNGRYEGEMNGQGIYYFNDGDRYEGNWKDDKRNGQGIHYFNSGDYKGDRYKGNFKDDKYNGQGIYYFNPHATMIYF
jgi:caspase 3